MTASGTTSFSPNFAVLMEEAFERAGVDPAKNTARHIRSAMLSINLMLTASSADGIHEWKMVQTVQNLTSGTATYNLASGAFDVDMAMFRTPGGGGDNDIDVPMTRLTRNDFFGIAEKDLAAATCTSYWVNRDRDTPTITVWPVPDSSDNQIVYFSLVRLDDAGEMTNTPDVPFYWFDALAAGWAARIAQKYNYDRFADLTVLARDALLAARIQDGEHTGVTVSYECGGQQ